MYWLRCHLHISSTSMVLLKLVIIRFRWHINDFIIDVWSIHTLEVMNSYSMVRMPFAATEIYKNEAMDGC